MLPSAQRQYEEQEAMKLATGEGDDDIVNTPLMEAVIQKYLNDNSKQNVSRSLALLVPRFLWQSKRGMRGSKSSRSSRKTSNSKVTPKIIIHPRPGPKVEDSEKNKGILPIALIVPRSLPCRSIQGQKTPGIQNKRRPSSMGIQDNEI